MRKQAEAEVVSLKWASAAKIFIALPSIESWHAPHPMCETGVGIACILEAATGPQDVSLGKEGLLALITLCSVCKS